MSLMWPDCLGGRCRGWGRGKGEKNSWKQADDLENCTKINWFSYRHDQSLAVCMWMACWESWDWVVGDLVYIGINDGWKST